MAMGSPFFVVRFCSPETMPATHTGFSPPTSTWRTSPVALVLS